jgi:FkbM family methyltransferase
MNFSAVKSLANRVGLYRQARWLNRHLINRAELRQERNDLDFYRAFIDPGDLVYDVGANYGEKSRVFLKLGARVVAFEPQPDCRAELEARCGKNGNLEVLQVAVGAEPGKGTLYVRQQRGVSGLIKDWEGEIDGSIEVPIVKLDDVIKTHGRPKYVKVDVEGFEYEVLKGLRERVDWISFEYHLYKETDVRKTVECLQYLSKLGPYKVNITPAERLVFVLPDWLTPQDFLAQFPQKLLTMKLGGYGDVFVRFDGR